MKKILNMALAALMLLPSAGCIKDAENSVYLTADQASQFKEAYVSGIPLAMLTIGQAGAYVYCEFGYPGIMVARDMMTGDIEHFDYTYDLFHLFSSCYYGSWGAQGVNPSYFWNSYYPWIKACNDVIRIGIESGETETTDIGVARAFRALFYLDMVRLYAYKPHKYIPTPTYEGVSIEGLSIPIVTETTTEREAANNPRVQAEVVYDLILSDLAEAKRLLDGYVRPNSMMPDLAVVYGLLARTFLEFGDKSVTFGERTATGYKLASEYARKAISTSGCTPLSQAEWEDPVTGFNSYSANSSWMWSLNQISDQVNNLVSFTAWMAPEQTWGQGSYDMATYGVSEAFYNMITYGDFRKHSWIDPDGKRFYRYRLNWQDEDAFLAAVDPYVSIKFRPGSGELSNYRVGNATDVPLMRVEEMYFIDAEATAHESLSEGRQILDNFMQQYRMAEGSYSSGSATTLDEFVTEVLLQKRIEFWGEGLILFDLKRLGTGCTESDYPFSTYQTVAPYWNLCIPRSEMQNNPGIQINNPDPTQVLGE